MIQYLETESAEEWVDEVRKVSNATWVGGQHNENNASSLASHRSSGETTVRDTHPAMPPHVRFSKSDIAVFAGQQREDGKSGQKWVDYSP